MEKYILPIILSLFLIYLFCFREKKRLIEGNLTEEITDGELATIKRELGPEFTGIENDALRSLVQSMPNPTSMNEDAMAALLNSARTDTTHLNHTSVNDALASIRRENPSEGRAVATRDNEPGTGGNHADDAGGTGGTPADEPAGGGDGAAAGNETPNPEGEGSTVASAAEQEEEDSFRAAEDNLSPGKKRKNDAFKDDADKFLKEMSESREGRRILNREGYRVEGEGAERRVVNKSHGSEIRDGQKKDLYQKFEKDGEGNFGPMTSPNGVDREVTEQIKGKLTRLYRKAKEHPYVALGLTAAGVILFNRESEEDCIETCTGSPDEDWKKAHKVESTYDNHCPEPDCQEFCSASGTGQCSVARRNAASAHEVLEEVTEDAEGMGGSVFEVAKEFLEDEWLPIAVCCGVMILSSLSVFAFNILRTKTTNLVAQKMDTRSGKFLKQMISPNAKGGGIKDKLNSPKLIILFVFFIFIVYNGRRR
jgi:hypothetical protein